MVGTLDIEKAIQKGERHFEPGVLAAANRGVLYVDEVNLLDDHVVDLLLDVAAMGVNVVEREGISFSHPARFVLIGTHEPRRRRPAPAVARPLRAVRGHHGHQGCAGAHADSGAQPGLRSRLERHSAQEWDAYEKALTLEIAEARERLPKVKHTQRDLATIANLVASLGVDGHRADLVILKTARAHAAFMGREEVTENDILVAAELALPHRLKRHPFQDTEQAMAVLSEKLQQIEQQTQQMVEQQQQQQQAQADANAKKAKRG